MVKSQFKLIFTIRSVLDLYFTFPLISYPAGELTTWCAKRFVRTLTPILYEEVGTTISNNVSAISTKDLLASEQF
jgi:hypothetical protein